jgi:O-antigen ligase
MEARRPQVADLGVFLLVVAAPLVFTPFTQSPFGDPKVVAVAGGGLALWAAGLPGPRLLAWLAGAWVGITAVAALVGADPWRGLTAQTGGEGGGLIVTLVCAIVLLAGAGASARLSERARSWFVIACAAVGVFGILIRLFPGTFGEHGGISFVGATMGNQLFAGALLAAGMVAAMGDRRQPLSRQLPLVGLLALATATFGERSAVVLPVVATIAFVLTSRIPWRRAAALGAVVLAALGAWQVVAHFIPSGGRGASLAVGSQATDTERFTVWRVLVTRAVPDRPILGWGPGSTQSAYLSNATEEEVRRTTREWADAHDLPIESLVTTGWLGLLALLAVLGVAVVRAVRGPPERAWAFAAAAALGVYALFEPVNLVLTPLLFLFMGMAATPADTTEPARGWERPVARVAHVVAGVLLVGAMAVSLLMLSASALERWGRQYGEEWAYHDALRLQPWRTTATTQLALQLAVEGRSGDAASAAEAHRLMSDAIAAQPWDVDLRPNAADVETLLGDPQASAAWIQQQLARFPGDRAGLEAAASAPSGP